MRKSFWQSIFIVPVYIVWGVVALGVTLLGFAAVVASSNFGVWSYAWVSVDFPSMKQFLKATGTGYDSLFQWIVWLFPAVGVILTFVLARIESQRVIKPDKVKLPSPQTLERQRKTLLKNVRNRLRNIADQQPYYNFFVELGKSVSSHNRTRSAPPPPATLPIIEIFDRSDGWLLILGAPGAGKSTTVNSITNELWARAELDSTERIPVVFSLASWNGNDKTLDEWLVRNLKADYDISPVVASYWIAQDKLLPLLDALDEASPAVRKSCVLAINEFRARHTTQVVVSSREDEYETTGEKLDVGVAIQLKPLNDAQIDKFVCDIGKDGLTLQELLGAYPKLRELAQTPFMLTTMASSSSQIAANVVSIRHQAGQISKLVLDSYIRQMLLYAKDDDLLTAPSQMTHYVSYMAKAMWSVNSSAFLPELSHNLPAVNRAIDKIHLTLQRKSTILGVLWGVAFLGLSWALYPYIRYLLPPQALGIWRALAPTMLLITVPFLIWNFYSLPRSIKREFGSKELQGFHRSVKTYRAEKPALILLPMITLYFVAPLLFIHLSVYSTRPEVLASPSSILGLSINQVFFACYCFYLALLFLPLAYIWLIRLGVFKRLSLHLEGSFPWNARRFMEDCVTLKFVYRVGPAYAFIHRLLLEHFAELDPARLNLDELDAEWKRRCGS